MDETVRKIPNFILYGEEDDDNPSDFGHIETIAERSSVHDWEIETHRHSHSLQVVIISEGQVTAWLDGTRTELAAPCHVVVPAGAVHGFRFTPDTRGWVLTLGQEFARRAGSSGDPLSGLLTEGSRGILQSETARRVEMLATELLLLDREWSRGSPFHALAEALMRSLPMDATPASGEDRRLAQFRRLIETHLAEHRPISFYAQALGATERTLTRLVRRRLDCTPLEAINRRLALEARRLLRHTNASVTQVAMELGFADPSYFSRFYLRITGRRPASERG